MGVSHLRIHRRPDSRLRVINKNSVRNWRAQLHPEDWRAQLQPDSRRRIVNWIMDTLKRHLPICGPEGLHELKKIAIRFEEKIYTTAMNQSDYLRKISMKMLNMENKSQRVAGSLNEI